MKRALGMSLCLVCLVASAAFAQTKASFVPVFDGTLKGWTIENTTAGNIAVRDGVLSVQGPAGWLKSARQYTDFTMRLQFRFITDDADSGIFFRTAGTTQFMRGWPNNGYQVQIRNPLSKSFLPAVGGLFRHGMPNGEIKFDEPLVSKLSRGTGAWQDLELTVSGTTLTVRLNGTEVTRAENVVRQPGHLGVQAEAGTLEFRAIEIAE